MPNLDLINTVKSMARHDGIHVSLHDRMFEPGSNDPLDVYLSGLHSTAHQMQKQASGRMSGLHGIFQKYFTHT